MILTTENQKDAGKSISEPLFSTARPTWTSLGSNMGTECERPVTDYLTMAQPRCFTAKLSNR